MNNKPAELPEDLACFTLGPLPTNAYLIEDKYLVDPGGMNPNLRSKLDDTVECLEAILLTHCHWDHIDGINDILELYPDCKILCHSDEFEMLSDPEQNFSTMRGDSGISFEADAPLESSALRADGEELEILETPGHSPGGISIYWKDRDAVFSGDALFKRGVGRTDLPGSDPDQLMRSIQDVLLELPEDTQVYPGHGPATTIGDETETNPFLQSRK